MICTLVHPDVKISMIDLRTCQQVFKINNINDVNSNLLKNIAKNKGKGLCKLLSDWDYENITVTVWGWDDGSESKINKFELPPPIDTILYYGDLIFIGYNNETDEILEFNEERLMLWYNHVFGGFDSIENTDDEDEEEDDEDDEDESPTQSDLDFIDDRNSSDLSTYSTSSSSSSLPDL